MSGQPQTVMVVQGPPSGTVAIAVVDDPCCLYVWAVVGFLFPIAGFIAMCCYGCGKNLPPKQTSAFKALVIATLAGVVVGIIYSASASSS